MYVRSICIHRHHVLLFCIDTRTFQCSRSQFFHFIILIFASLGSRVHHKITLKEMILYQYFSLLLIFSLHQLGLGFTTSPTFGIENSHVCKKGKHLCSMKISQHMTSSRSSSDEEPISVPTEEQLEKDSFMKQLSHASQLVSMLQDEHDTKEEDRLGELLKAQLSHSDGIRGFFATYLTWDNEEGQQQLAAADIDDIPQPLAKAMEATDPSILVPLACMNVVMPTAMSTMHQDPDLQSSAELTARRGSRILSFLAKNDHDSLVAINCNAIIEATSVSNLNDTTPNERVEYWVNFFNNYGYETQQRQDIMKAIKNINI